METKWKQNLRDEIFRGFTHSGYRFQQTSVEASGFPYFSENVIRPAAHPLMETQSCHTYPVILSEAFSATLPNDFLASSLWIKLARLSNWRLITHPLPLI